MANELDDLMDKNPLNYSTADLDKIIAYQRQHRANVESGVKVKKDQGPKVKVTLESLGLKKAPAAAPKSPGLRRI